MGLKGIRWRLGGVSDEFERRLGGAREESAMGLRAV